ncbi:hypothetical protein CISG_02890 [Coccidioides immitis RMSCC 3703]|uniref:Uncharacterized protein n=1 Tax=Coccidioides immitis RMSCC 3703 TaxID=454286 RepID=A0A0J8R9W1_COCIT|nr:hypothetical protein CISG_02890 [Coccidioides immitis RMSCC 3703]
MTNSQQSSGSPSARAPPAASGAASSSSPDVPSAPSRRDLASWWKQFKRNTKKDETAPQSAGIFGVPLNVSIKYANVAISLTGDDGKSFVYGYVPIVVAKCGVFLKEKATDVEGIFRLSGSAKRIGIYWKFLILLIDEQTVKEMQEGIYAHPAKSGIRRSASNASGGADSLRKYETLRRNVSVSSKTSKQSGGNVTSPATPRSVSSFGVHRSNTVPSKRPPGLSPTAFNRSPHPSNPPTGGLSPSASPLLASRSQSRVSSIEAMNEAKNTRPDLSLDTNPPAAKADAEARPQQNVPGPIISKPVVTPNKERKLSSLFAWSSPPEDGRQPNRLRKKRRIPGSASESAQSSTQSLHDNSYDIGSSPPPLVRGLSDTDLDQSHVSTPRILTTSSLATAMTR